MQHLPGRTGVARPPAREGRCHTSLNCSRRYNLLSGLSDACDDMFNSRHDDCGLQHQGLCSDTPLGEGDRFAYPPLDAPPGRRHDGVMNLVQMSRSLIAFLSTTGVLCSRRLLRWWAHVLHPILPVNVTGNLGWWQQSPDGAEPTSSVAAATQRPGFVPTVGAHSQWSVPVRLKPRLGT